MNDELLQELEELRAYKKATESKGINRAFTRLEQLLEISHFDPTMSIRAFRVIADCLLCLKDEIK
jgi:hypothetical protein